MSRIKHLGTTKELTWFANEMAEQLEKHEKEKTSLRDVDFEEVKRFVIREMRLRLDKIENLNGDNFMELPEITKQFTHIANYSMFGFLRGKYNV